MAQPTVKDFAHANGRSIAAVANKDFNQYPALIAPSAFVVRSQLPTITAAVTVGAVAYFVYLGRTRRRLTAQKVLFHVSTAGASTQVGEVGLFSSPTAPNRAAQTLTKICASGTLDDLTAAGVKGNTTAFAQDVDAGTELWAGYRVDMASTEPAVFGLTNDLSCGQILSLAAATAFTAASTYAGGLIAVAASAPVWQAPNLTLHCS